jgi:acetyl-CoA C-acetyltransferase
MEAIRIASMAIRQSEAKAIIAGGSESMSNVSYSIKNARWGMRLQHRELTDGVWDGLTDPHTGLIMGMTAENVAEKYNISREDQDRFAYRSQMQAKKAVEDGRFKDEIVPIKVP